MLHSRTFNLEIYFAQSLRSSHYKRILNKLAKKLKRKNIKAVIY